MSKFVEVAEAEVEESYDQKLARQQQDILKEYETLLQQQQCKEPYPVRIFILSLIKADNAQELRNKWERISMARLNTYVPYGMNIQD